VTLSDLDLISAKFSKTMEGHLLRLVVVLENIEKYLNVLEAKSNEHHRIIRMVDDRIGKLEVKSRGTR
jgi:hypothetical protein